MVYHVRQKDKAADDGNYDGVSEVVVRKCNIVHLVELTARHEDNIDGVQVRRDRRYEGIVSTIISI